MRADLSIRHSAAWAALLLLLACGENTGPSSGGAVGLEIEPTEVAIKIGETRTLSVAFLDAEGGEVAAPGAVEWSSSDEGVAVVEGGEVRGVAPGSARVTASSGRLSGEVDVQVLLPAGELETDAASSATVDSAGGVITTTGRDGTRYTLHVPAGALDSPTQITVTPLDRLEALPLSGGFAVGVDFAPDGLEFRRPAELEIVPGSATGPGHLVGFSMTSESFRLKPAWPSGDTLRLVIGHFSGAGAATGTSEEVNALASQPGSAAEAAEAAIAEALANAAAGGSHPDPAELAAHLAAWYDNVVAPGLASGSGSAEAAIAAFLKWWGNASLLGVDELLGGRIEAGMAAVANLIGSEIDRLNAQCRSNNDPSVVPEILSMASTAALLGLDTPGSGLDYASVLADLCQQLVIHSVSFPDTVEAGQPATLEVVAGLAIGNNPPTGTRPVEVSVSAGGSASIAPQVGMVGADGRFNATVTAISGQKKVTLEIMARALDLPLPSVQKQVEAVVKQEIVVTISPETAEIKTGGELAFTATVEGADDDHVTWSATGGFITREGFYTAPNEPGTYLVTATSQEDPNASATAEVEVVPGSMVTPMLHHRNIWSSRATVYAGQQIHHVPEDQLFDSYSISTSSSGGFASLSGDYSYGEDGSITEIGVQSTMKEYPPVTAPTYGQANYSLVFRLRGMPLNMVLKGTCTLEGTRSIVPGDSHLSVRVHDEPSNLKVDVQVKFRLEGSCTKGIWTRTIELGPGIYVLSIANYGIRNVDYDFTIDFEEVEEENR